MAVSWFGLLLVAFLALAGLVLVAAIVVALTTTRRRRKDENTHAGD